MLDASGRVIHMQAASNNSKMLQIEFMAKKPSAPKALYPNCADHLETAGLSNQEAAKLADLSPSSILRMKNGQPVSATTCSKMLNALNDKHFDGTRAPRLVLAKEVVKVDGSGGET